MASSSLDPPLKVYTASIVGNTEIRKQVQRTLFILQSLNVPFKEIDITQRGNQEHRSFMQEHAINKRHKGVPLPPQFFHNDDYIGNYVDFEEAVEENEIATFLKLIPSSTSVKGSSAEPEDEEGDDDEEEDEEGEDEEEDEDEAEGDEQEGDEAEDEEGDEEGDEEEDKENAVTVTLRRPEAAKEEEKAEDEEEGEGEDEEEYEDEGEEEEEDEEEPEEEE
uniref:Glutaredoxin domain-containing protein n=1 Tax=Steinernema glaseri TaxID=37863 RepID=A0A1I7ZWI0_9BILA